MAQILRPGSAYPPADFTTFLGFVSTGEAYKRPREFAKRLIGAEITQENRLIKARGYREILTWNDNRIREILQYRNELQDVFLVFGTSANGLSGAVASVSAQWTSAAVLNEILTTVDLTAEPCLLEFGNNAYYYDGTNDQWWDGSVWRPIGGAAPAGAPTFTSTIAGAMNTNSQYYVSWRWYDPINFRQTNLSPISDVMTTGATGADAGLRVALPAESAPDSGFTQRQVFVTLAFSSQLFLDQTVSAATTSVDIVSADIVRAVNEIYEGLLDDAPYRKYNIVVKANNKIYGARTDDTQCRLERSRVSPQVGALPQSWSPKNFTPCEPSASDLIVGLGVCGSQENQTVIVVKQKSFGKIVEISPGVEIYQKLGDIGGHGHKSIFQFGTKCGWVNESNCYVTDGSGYIEMGGGEDGLGIVDTFRGLSQLYKPKVNSVHVPNSKQIRISLVTEGQAWPDICLFGHYDKLESLGLIKWTSRQKGPNPTQNPGVNAASMKVVLDNTDQFQTIFGNSNGNGKLYQWDFGTSDDGAGIFSQWVFRPETFGDLKNEKLFSDIHLRMRTGNTSTTVFLGVQKNLREAITPLQSITLSGLGFIMGVSRMGITPFSNAPVFSEIIPCQIRGEELAFAIESFDTHTLELLDFTMTGIA